MLKKYWDANFIFINIIVPLVVSILYCVSFAYISSQFLPEGVNYVFVNKFGNYLLFALLGVYILFFITKKLNKNGTWKLPISNEKVVLSDLILLLLPLTPIVQYLILNQETLSFIDILCVFVFFVLFSGFYILVIPLLLSLISSYRVMQVVGLTFAFTITNMAILSNSHSWLGKGSLKYQLPVVIILFLATLLLINLKNKWMLYLPVLVFFLSSGFILVFSQSNVAVNAATSSSEYKLPLAVQGKKPITRPNIYLLAYDAYVPNETMLGYGIDNKKQEDYLSEQGFKLYPHTYTIFSDTLRSMNTVLDASTTLNKNLRTSVSGDSKVIHLFKDLGYETYGIFPYDFMFGGHTPKYDFFTPKYSDPLFTKLISGVLLGEFRFDIGFNDQPHEQFLIEKESLFNRASKNQSFVYMHTDLPSHSQRSGACLSDETDLFKQRLSKANREMTHDIQNITENDPSAIVIVIGDHGPYLTKNCAVLRDVYDISQINRLDIQDRYGTFLAIKWPTKDYALYDDITVIQDIFPAVFAYLYNDITILESKINPVITMHNVISGATVNNGMISGGINNGEPLFLSNR